MSVVVRSAMKGGGEDRQCHWPLCTTGSLSQITNNIPDRIVALDDKSPFLQSNSKHVLEVFLHSSFLIYMYIYELRE